MFDLFDTFDMLKTRAWSTFSALSVVDFDKSWFNRWRQRKNKKRHMWLLRPSMPYPKPSAKNIWSKFMKQSAASKHMTCSATLLASHRCHQRKEDAKHFGTVIWLLRPWKLHKVTGALPTSFLRTSCGLRPIRSLSIWAKWNRFKTIGFPRMTSLPSCVPLLSQLQWIPISALAILRNRGGHGWVRPSPCMRCCLRQLKQSSRNRAPMCCKPLNLASWHALSSMKLCLWVKLDTLGV